jgi:hypothetical protein
LKSLYKPKKACIIVLDFFKHWIQSNFLKLFFTLEQTKSGNF